MHIFLHWARRLALPVFPFYLLLWLMVLLILGTIAQKYVGLYAAQETFFFSWILFVGPIPLPGGLTTLVLLTISLLAKLLVASPWTPKNAGTILAHTGVLVLLIGGLLTFADAKDGSITLFPGDRTNYFSSYTARELTIQDTKTGKTLQTIPENRLNPGMLFPLPAEKAKIEIVKFCANCDFISIKSPAPDRRGMAARLDIAPLPSEKAIEENRSALQFRATGTKEDGIYFTTDFIDKAPHITVGDQTFKISLHRSRTQIPFSIELLKFMREDHPGTSIARAYASNIILYDQGTTWRGQITMNEPLRYRGYTFYQSSFISTENGEATVLSVVENNGRLFPYIASLITAIGLLLHMALRSSSLFRATPAIFLFALCLSSPVYAADQKINLSTFAELPILDEGRIKPLDSFSRTQLTPLIGRDRLNEGPAIFWLAELLFDPKSAYTRSVFRITDPRVRTALSLPDTPHNRYTYKDLASAFYRARETLAALEKMPEDTLAEPQRHLLDLFRNTQRFALLSRSFAFLSDGKIYAEDTGSVALRVLPGQELKWLSPWEQMREGAPNAETKELLTAWRNLGTAWQKNDQATWDKNITTIKKFVAPHTSRTELMLEVAMNVTKPFTLALLLYTLSLLVICAAPLFHSSLWLRRSALGLLGVGFIIHTTGLSARMLLMDRPPVTNLYSSILFVACITIIAGWITERRLRNNIGLAIASFSGAALLFIGRSFSREGDTMGVLPAVLDTNFWLSTHVTMMTAGYALSLVVGLLAHTILARNILWPFDTTSTGLQRALQSLTLSALFATTTGTVLGGIWADQSWGRFWGWDPKENGALLIVLWILAALHGRLSGHLNQNAYTAFLALLPVVVALAWFGVNLLGVGLHSYGFTQGATRALGAFCTTEILLVATLFYLARQKSRIR